MKVLAIWIAGLALIYGGYHGILWFVAWQHMEATLVAFVVAVWTGFCFLWALGENM